MAHSNRPAKGVRMRAWGFWVFALLLGAVSFVSRGARSQGVAEKEFPGWPGGLVPPNAVAVAHSAHPQLLSGGSPYVQICLEDDITWVVRWLPRADRNAHPAIDCFRAQGFATSEVRTVEVSGTHWQEFMAERDRSLWQVRQRWIGTNGDAWSDVSSWFWANRTEGSGFTVVTVAPVLSAKKGTGPF